MLIVCSHACTCTHAHTEMLAHHTVTHTAHLYRSPEHTSCKTGMTVTVTDEHGKVL